MPYDYSSLFSSEDGYTDTWREVYDDSLGLPHNLLYILQHTILLPHDFYDIITAYFLLPSALCRVVPYLFLYGQSGSGKSTVAKIASYLHGVSINSSSDTFAGIRNSLDKRRNAVVEVPSSNPLFPTVHKEVERNTCMVWDDISSQTFTSQPELYNMFKFGYDRTTDKIILSSKEVGENLEFRCFCPKIFSSISPLHLNDTFRELRRRMIVIPCKRVEELSDERKADLRIDTNDWQGKLLDLTAYDWKGFNRKFDEFWDVNMARCFVDTRKIISKSCRGLTSQQRAISIDLLSCGIAIGIWSDEDVAIERVKVYWDWFKQETERNAGLGTLLKGYIAQEVANAKAGNRELELYTSQLRSQVEQWVTMGWLFEKPRPKDVKDLMLDLGWRLQHGKWIKG